MNTLATAPRRALVTFFFLSLSLLATTWLSTARAATAAQPDAITADGGKYYGTLLNGKFHGKGRIVWENGAVYKGEFENGYYKDGEINYPDGDKYKGHFAKGLFQGKGHYETAKGEIFDGEFDKGQFTGQGIHIQIDKSRHEGMFKNWHPDGKGTYSTSGMVYEGQFSDDDLNGKGKLTDHKGNQYEGEFKNWQFHGKGTYRFANGDEYKGFFKYGKYDGEGTLTYAKPQKDGRTKDSGLWRYGSLESQPEQKETKQNVEAALYNQRTLLDTMLANIAPGDPARINLYMLAIGGDGKQEVFRREVEYVQKQFDRDFGTQSRSLALINSRTTVTSKPMATLTSIRESLNTIASRMDKQKDILFLYLTSHGSKTHEFILDQNGMELNSLAANELGKILKHSGIRWKVVVVSACYSGGFIAPLKDDHTLVITAARHDRTSFGCADENDFTYFGRAYFKEALPVSSSFTDAFSKAKTLVTQWEADDLKNGATEKDNYHSEPQIHAGPKIEKYLQQWWKLQKRAGTQPASTKPIFTNSPSRK